MSRVLRMSIMRVQKESTESVRLTSRLFLGGQVACGMSQPMCSRCVSIQASGDQCHPQWHVGLGSMASDSSSVAGSAVVGRIEIAPGVTRAELVLGSVSPLRPGALPAEVSAPSCHRRAISNYEFVFVIW